jgi:Ca2+-transporting ATPase
MEEVDEWIYTSSIEQVFEKFSTSIKGLTQKKIESKNFNKNILPNPHPFKPIKILLQQFNSFLIYLLLASSFVLFYLKNNLDAWVILGIVFLNAGIGFFQQYKAEKAIISLKNLIISKSKVWRDGKLIIIPSENLVPGDIILLEAGDKVNADMRIIKCENLQTNEAILTGESLPVSKSCSILRGKTSLSKIENMLFTGTQVVNGNVTAVVVAIGENTVFGKIAKTLQEVETPETPMQKKVNVFSRQLGILIIFIVGVILLVGLFEKVPFLEMFLTSVALAVGAIPEGLPAVLAISFSISSVILSRQNVIIRRLPAVEALGSVTVICSDKTGTLTEEKMQVQKIFSENHFFQKKEKNLFFDGKKIDAKKNDVLFSLIKASVLCNNARYEILEGRNQFVGDPTEQALISSALDLGFDKKFFSEKEPSIKKIHFDSKRKMMSVIRDSGIKNTMYSKGAPEKILELCSRELVSGEIKNLNEKRKKEILEELRKMEKEAFRVLGFAYNTFSKNVEPKESSLIFLGFIGMIDPPRIEIKNAIAQCQSAGIKVKIITGDSAITASAIANQIGIMGEVVTEFQVEKMSDIELLQRMDAISIFARVTPSQKLRITKLLQQRGEVVAITGDGVNDVLALKSADIGIAMGIRGTDVARDVSDMVLTDDNFASIVKGVEQGRRVYDNIKKSTKFLLAVNFSEIFLILTVLFMKLPLPLLPLQLLWMNLITDSFPAFALSMEKEEGVMKTKPRKESGLLHGIWGFIALAGFIAFLSEFLVYMFCIIKDFPIEETRSIVLTTGVLFELFFVYTCRSNLPLIKKGIFSNKWVNYAVLFSLALQFVLIYTPLGFFFGVVPLSLYNWLIILPAAFLGLVVFELIKYFFKASSRV